MTGSSPPTRGTRHCRDRPADRRRFIPAYAGNTEKQRLHRLGNAVHPRVRGEHIFLVVNINHCVGSSPRTRGTPDINGHCLPRYRFIPAYAGNTSTVVQPRPAAPVHPRVRGEHGSGLHQSAIQFRFIPAYAGNTGTASRNGVSRSVHPRVRGEHQITPCVAPPLGGSSPRTRGTQPAARPRPCHCRFIPAYAGNTAAGNISQGV